MQEPAEITSDPDAFKRFYRQHVGAGGEGETARGAYGRVKGIQAHAHSLPHTPAFACARGSAGREGDCAHGGSTGMAAMVCLWASVSPDEEEDECL